LLFLKVAKIFKNGTKISQSAKAFVGKLEGIRCIKNYNQSKGEISELRVRHNFGQNRTSMHMTAKLLGKLYLGLSAR